MPASGQAVEPPLHWYLAPEGASAWRAWDDDVVVFNDRAASTHRLDAASSAIFLMLVEQPGLTSTQIIDSLTSDGDHPTPEEIGHLRDILNGLQACGLAESRAS